MVAHQHLNKWGKTMGAERNLWSHGEVGESGLVKYLAYTACRGYTAGPMVAAIEGESQPAVEIIGSAGAHAAGIRVQAAAYREQGYRLLAVESRVGMKEGVSAVQLPLRRRLVLSCGE